MSTSPSYYSGRGATTDDLNDAILEKIWTAVEKNRGKNAAKAFVDMVEAVPVLSATDFLITLAALDRADWKWHPRLVSSAKGVDIARNADGSHNEASGLATMASMLFGRDRDQTFTIRGAFLRRHGRKVKTPPNVYGY
jgi:hypothetical protein